MATYYTIYFRGSTNDAWGYPESITVTNGSGAYIPSHTPARTGYDFKEWNTASDGSGGSYNPGDFVECNKSNVYLYAQWEEKTFTVTYNANGGSGAFPNQTKYYDSPLTLSSTVPTRTNYTFKGWGISPSSTTVVYSAGAKYTDNADITLYAIWELNYGKPSITNFKVYRSNSSGSSSDTGTYFKVSFDWSTYKSVSSILVEWVTSGGTTWSNGYITASGTSGSASGVFGSGNISVDRNYNIRVTVKDANGSTTVTGRVGGQSYTVDFMPGGSGVAFGKYAEQADLFEVDWNAKFNGNLTVTGTITNEALDNRLDSIEDDISKILLEAYPVNSIYLSYSHKSPAELFGGTWTRLSPYFLYATGETGVIGETFSWEQLDPYSPMDGPNYGGTNVSGIKISAWRRTA